MAAVQHSVLDNPILLGSLEPVHVLSCLDRRARNTPPYGCSKGLERYDDSATVSDGNSDSGPDETPHDSRWLSMFFVGGRMGRYNSIGNITGGD